MLFLTRMHNIKAQSDYEFNITVTFILIDRKTQRKK